MTMLITGGAGYIGSQMAWILEDAGRKYVILDDLSMGFPFLVPDRAKLIVGDIANSALVRHLIGDYGILSILHFAGSASIPESVANPLAYYDNNTAKSGTLIATAIKAGVENFLFSSTAAVYGDVDAMAVAETAALSPVSPYGRSKLAIEWMLEDAHRAHGLRYASLRYFNVAGADLSRRCGQASPQSMQLIKVAVQTALGKRDALTICGTDYPTPDGTGVRDYIHVVDLIDAHLLALSLIEKGRSGLVLNCGCGHGSSVREVISVIERITGRPLPVKVAQRRAGDAAYVVADATKMRMLGWRPKYNSLETMVRTSLDWEEALERRAR